MRQLKRVRIADLSQERFGIGSAINQTARQLGAVVGALVIVVVEPA